MTVARTEAKRSYKKREAFPDHIAWIRRSLCQFRKKRGFTQVQLADRMGDVRGRVTDLERGEKKMADLQIGTVLRFLKAMGISPEMCLRGCPNFGNVQPSAVIVTCENDVLDALQPMLNKEQVERVLTKLRS